MYSDYVNECKNASKRQLSYVTYTRQTRELNIGFAKLGTEECEQVTGGCLVRENKWRTMKI